MLQARPAVPRPQRPDVHVRAARDAQDEYVAGQAIGTLMSTRSATPSAVQPKVSAPEIVERYNSYVEGIVDYFHAGLAHGQADRRTRAGQRHRRHPHDEPPGGGLREEPPPPHGVRHRRRPRPADDDKRRINAKLERKTPSRCCGCSSRRRCDRVTRLHYGHINPRSRPRRHRQLWRAMYMAPVGIANAGDATGAYAEAIEVAEEGPVQAGPRGRCGASPHHGRRHGSDRHGRQRAGHGGRHRPRQALRTAIEACVGAVEVGTDWRDAIPLLRTAVTPYDSWRDLPASSQDYRTSLRSIESVALGLLKATGGDARGTILGATNSGRDSDSIATVGGALAGALGGGRPRCPPTGRAGGRRVSGSTCAPGDG